jgi:hypothetical protein
MSRFFQPTLADLGGFEYDRVPVCETSDGILVALTDQREQAVTAMNAYLILALGVTDQAVTGSTRGLKYGLGLFEWEPDGSDSRWSVRLGCAGDRMAVALHYLPN